MSVLHGDGIPGWLELTTSDLHQGLKFYTEYFGWTNTSMGTKEMEYHVLTNQGKTIGGFYGMYDELGPRWLVHFETSDLDKAIEAVKANGGQTLGDMIEVPGGQFIFAQDPVGTPFGLLQGEVLSESRGEINGICWYELQLKGEIDRVADFYQAIFGWSLSKEMEGPDMTYFTFGPSAQVQVGGLYTEKSVEKNQWTVTFEVEDVEAMAEKAKALGGTVLFVSKDTPYGDFAGILDDQGGYFHIMKPNKVKDK